MSRIKTRSGDALVVVDAQVGAIGRCWQAPRVVGSGWHERAGQPHAEVHALAAAGAAARGATAYLTLEPCSHTGRTGLRGVDRSGVTRPPRFSVCHDKVLTWKPSRYYIETNAPSGAAKYKDPRSPFHHAVTSPPPGSFGVPGNRRR